MSMKAMIFAAGLGTRFKPWTDRHPKALAPINGKSLLQRNIEYLQQYGITDVVINVHHFASQVVDAVEQHRGWGSNITISDETGVLLETGGGLMKARRLLEGSNPVLILNVDILTNLRINDFVQYHQANNPLVTLAVSNRMSSRYFLFNDAMQLCGWENTATGEQKISRTISPLQQKAYSGIALLRNDFFSLVQQEGKFSLTDTYLDLAGTHEILGYDHSGDLWMDVGKPEVVAKAEVLFP